MVSSVRADPRQGLLKYLMVPVLAIFLPLMAFMLAQAIIGPALVALVFLTMAESAEVNQLGRLPPVLVRITSSVSFLMGIGGMGSGLAAFTRGLWQGSARRLVENLATSKVRSAAVGLVELRGRGYPLSEEDAERPILGSDGRHRRAHGPFYLDDGTGRVLVEVPPMRMYGDARFALRRLKPGGPEVLMPGDEVHVIGDLVPNPQNEATDEPNYIVRPWIPPSSMYPGRWIRLLAAPDVFLVAAGSEKDARHAVVRDQRIHLALGAALAIGALFAMAVGLVGLVRPV